MSEAGDAHPQFNDQNNREAFQPHIYETHGNMNFMHCSNEDAEHS